MGGGTLTAARGKHGNLPSWTPAMRAKFAGVRGSAGQTGKPKSLLQLPPFPKHQRGASDSQNQKPESAGPSAADVLAGELADGERRLLAASDQDRDRGS